MRVGLLVMLMAFQLFFSGCSTPKIRIFEEASIPLREFVMEGDDPGKILVIPIRGVISDVPSKGLFYDKPSMVQEVVSQLRLAEKDSQIGAVVLKIDSPGGSTTASDILYHEIVRFKEKTGVKIVAVMMDVATSGGYYIALPSDRIVAHPTSVTGSVGVVFVGPKVEGLLQKIGVDVEVIKSGANKDMGSPFRESTRQEKDILQQVIQRLADRFTALVVKHRRLSDEAIEKVSSGRVYLADDALELGLIDGIGYLNDALAEAKKSAKLPQACKVVVYRKTEFADDNLYNTSTMQHTGRPSLLDLEPITALSPLSTGFYYLWTPGTAPGP